MAISARFVSAEVLFTCKLLRALRVGLCRSGAITAEWGVLFLFPSTAVNFSWVVTLTNGIIET
jgi:hypothetical protein